MSLGTYGNHFLVKTSKKVIFVTGHNAFHEIGIGNSNSQINFIAMNFNEQCSEIWGDVSRSKAKSARK